MRTFDLISMIAEVITSGLVLVRVDLVLGDVLTWGKDSYTISTSGSTTGGVTSILGAIFTCDNGSSTMGTALSSMVRNVLPSTIGTSLHLK